MIIKRSRYNELVKAEELLASLTRELLRIRNRGSDNLDHEVDVPSDPHFWGHIDGALWNNLLTHTRNEE